MDMHMCLSILSKSVVVFITQLFAPAVGRLLGSMQTPVECIAIVSSVFIWLWNLFVWVMAGFCMAPVCTACVSC